MAKIYENKQSFKWQPSLFEMTDHVVMAGQVYDKSTLAAIPFNTVDINSYSKDYLIGKTTWVRETDGAYECMGSAQFHGGQVGPSSYVVDSNDSSIAYVIAPRDDGTGMWAHKINLDNFDIIVSGETELGASADNTSGYYDYPGQCQIFYQDDDYIYYIHKHRSTRRQSYASTLQPTGKPHIGWISKSTMLQAGEYWTNDTVQLYNVTYLGMKGTTVFLAYTAGYWHPGYWNPDNDIIIRRWDTAAKTGATLVDHNEGTTFLSYGISSRPFDQGSDILHNYWTTRSDNAAEGYNIYKAETDMNGETATVSGCTYDWGSEVRASLITRHDVNDRHHKVITFTCDDGSNQYVSFLVTETPQQWDIDLDCFKVHTFLIGGDGSHLTYKSTLTPGFRIRGIIPLEDDYTKFMVIGDSHSTIYTWNDGTEAYIETSTVGIQCHAALVDSLNRLWMVDEQNNTHLLSSFSPLTITVIPENAEYNYQGSTINTYINVSAYDIDNTRIATNVRIVLEGSTYFTDDSQVKQITTSTGGETQVNIKVTGTSFTRILASVVV